MIQISKLPVIQTPKQFFDTEKVLFADPICLEDVLNHRLVMLLGDRPNTFICDGKKYYLFILKGSPENLLLNASRGVPFPFAKGGGAILKWEFKLLDALKNRKVFDLSKYANTGMYRDNLFDCDHEFLSNQINKSTPV